MKTAVNLDHFLIFDETPGVLMENYVCVNCLGKRAESDLWNYPRAPSIIDVVKRVVLIYNRQINTIPQLIIWIATLTVI